MCNDGKLAVCVSCVRWLHSKPHAQNRAREQSCIRWNKYDGRSKCTKGLNLEVPKVISNCLRVSTLLFGACKLICKGSSLHANEGWGGGVELLKAELQKQLSVRSWLVWYPNWISCNMVRESLLYCGNFYPYVHSKTKPALNSNIGWR